MFEAMRTYGSIGYKGVIRPDHVPLLAGEHSTEEAEKAMGYVSGKASGYTMMGRLYAVGYMRGLIEAVSIVTTAPVRRRPAESDSIASMASR